ncbi:hypothetical protein [Caenispirillum bisanense]|uniref:hypothetical protein n=1 Tax=Caenispirillum bisanense TaxID=414052 RepID=UPI0031D14D1E
MTAPDVPSPAAAAPAAAAVRAAGPVHPPVQAVEALIDTMVGKAAQHGASSADVAHGIVAALASLRETFATQGGYAAMRSFDDALRTHLLAHGLEQRRSLGREPARIRTLPAAGAHAARAAAILRDAVTTGLLLNIWGPGNLLLQVAAGRLLVRLVERLDGALPAWEALEEWLAVDADRALVAEPGPGPFPAGRLQ